MKKKSNRKIAQEKGEIIYISEKICKHCKTYRKYVSKSSCVKCTSESSKKRLKSRQIWAEENRKRVNITKNNYKIKRRSWELNGISSKDLNNLI